MFRSVELTREIWLIRPNTFMSVTSTYVFASFVLCTHISVFVCVWVPPTRFNLFIVCPQDVCVCIFYLHVSMGGHPGAFLPRQIQHAPLQAEKEKDFIVRAACEEPFRLQWGRVSRRACLKGQSLSGRSSSSEKVKTQFDSLTDL